jgi:AcrR family transcriptional regulator
MVKKSKPNTLTPAVIANCGLQLAVKQGVNEVSLRKIADELGVSPMAIYRHFTDKDQLLAAMLDLFIIEADVLPKQTLSWQAWLEHVGMAMYQALCAAPSWISLFGSLQLKPGAMAVLNDYLLVMTKAGFSHKQAAKGFFSLLQCLIGAATMHNAFSGDVADTAFLDQDFMLYPQVAQALPDIAQASTDNFMQSGLRLLIDGLSKELES